MNSHYVNEKEIAFLKQVGEKLFRNKISVGTAESCTGGRIASMITSIPNSSDHFVGAIVSYSEDIKKNILGVSANDIEQYGVVSKPVAEQMALGASHKLKCQCVIATTGIAGPDGDTPENPVGTVWIAVVVIGKIQSKRFLFSGDRQEIVQQSSYKALEMLLNMLD
jgi:PncC family amidohydrolase